MSEGEASDPPVPVETSFGRRVRDLRRQRGLSQEQLAGKLGMNQSALSRLEQGRRAVRLGEAAAIAEALRVSLDVLVFFDFQQGRYWELMNTLAQSTESLRSAAMDLAINYLGVIRYVEETPELMQQPPFGLPTVATLYDYIDRLIDINTQNVPQPTLTLPALTAFRLRQAITATVADLIQESDATP